MHLKPIVLETVLIIGIATAVSLVVNSISPNGIALLGQWDKTEGVVSAKAHNQKELAGIEIKDSYTAKRIFDNHEAIFVDARSQEQFEGGHIKGAISLPVWDIESEIEAFIAQYPENQPFVIYCSGRECEDSHTLAQHLLDVGYSAIRVYIDGFPAWKAEGFPVE